jgi:Uma2 family endonuclease
MASALIPPASAHPSRAALIVEIAESSDRIDREHKASLCARAGVAHYWIVDVVGKALEVHREPEVSPEALYGWRYGNVAILRPPAVI